MDAPPGSNSLGVIVSVMVLTPLSTVFVSARVYSCLIILRRRLYFEEWLCVMSLVGDPSLQNQPRAKHVLHADRGCQCPIFYYPPSQKRHPQ